MMIFLMRGSLRVMKKKEQSNNPTSRKKNWVQPIWFPVEPKKEDISPTGRTQEKPFSKKNINHKW